MSDATPPPSSTKGQPYAGAERRRWIRPPSAPARVIGRARVSARYPHTKVAPFARDRWVNVVDRNPEVSLPALEGYVWVDVDGRLRHIWADFLELGRFLGDRMDTIFGMTVPVWRQWSTPGRRLAGSEGPRNTPPGKLRPDAGTGTGGERPLVLIVDDHGALLHMMARWLAPEGYELLLASDARAAIDLVDRAARRLSGAVVDVRLPGVDGPRLVRSLRQRRTSLPVLFITGYAEDEQQKELRDPVLTKPFFPEQLAQQVREMLVGRTNRPPRTDRM